MNKDKWPDVLYRYRSCSGEYFPDELKQLKDNKVRLQAMSRQNDPFEGKPAIGVSSFEEFKVFLNDIRSVYGRHAGITGKKIDFERFPNYNEVELKRARDPKTIYGYAIQTIERLTHSLPNEMKIACFSESYNSILMWAHYANSHTGVCFKFNKINIKQEGTNWGKVQYIKADTKHYDASERPLLNTVDLLRNFFAGENKKLCSFEHIMKIHKAFALTKSSEWECEKEWRLYRAPSRNDYYTIPDYKVAGVIFGYRTKEETMRKIRERFGSSITYEQIQLSSTHYDMALRGSIYGEFEE